VKIGRKKGLIKVLLTDRKKLLESYSNNVFDIEFFQNYFNEDCESYLQYIIDNKLSEDRSKFLDLAESVGCEQAGMKIMYDEDPEYVINEIRELFRYDIVDDNRLVLDRGDLADILRPDYLAGILDDDGLFEDWFPEIDVDEINDILNDEEKNKLSKMMGKDTFYFDDLKDSDLLQELVNINNWAYRQAAEDEVYERIMKDLKNYFQTDDIKFDEDSKGRRLLSIKIDTFLKNIVHDYYTGILYEDFDVFSECSNFFCLLSEMIDYDDEYSIIDSVNLDYFYPNQKTVEELFHEYFKQEIG
jgi:hypothetical protein